MALILVVDDSMLARTMMGRMISALGHESLEASDGFGALEILESKQVSCVVLDLLMSGMKGLDFLRQHQQRNKHIPVIVATADLQEKTREQCLELGAVAVLHKPVQESALHDALDLAFEKKS